MATKTRPTKRDIDPEVATARGNFAITSRWYRDDPEVIAAAKAELERAKEIAAIKRAVIGAESLSGKEIVKLVRKLVM